jgi:hypothetical protein
MFKFGFVCLLLPALTLGCMTNRVATSAPPILIATTTLSRHSTATLNATSSPGNKLEASSTLSSTAFLPVIVTPPPDPVLLAAGDIAACGDQFNGDEATATLLDSISGTVAALGDNVYPSGTADQFAQCYAPTWGRHTARTRPVPGNHDYVTSNAAPYFQYFGSAAGKAGQGYYSYDLGTWHIIALNSNCGYIGGCDVGSAEYQWLITDLSAHPTSCTLAYFHHPRFSSGPHGANTFMQPIWQALFDAGTDVVLGGHDHDYERFAPQTPTGVADAQRGIREFVVGTGGYSHYRFGASAANSEVRNNDTFGVLQLTLHTGSYDWQFMPIAGQSFADSGTGMCH